MYISKIPTVVRSAALIFMMGFGLVALAPAESAGAAAAPVCSTSNVSISGGKDCAASANQKTDLGVIIRDITNVLLFVIGAVAVIVIIIGGIRYTISNGDSSQITAAKNTILYGVIGVVVALLAFAIVNFVVGTFANTTTTQSGNNISN